MLKQLTLAVALLVTCTMSVGCGDAGNTVIEQPDAEQMQAKKQEFAEFQEQMKKTSQLPARK